MLSVSDVPLDVLEKLFNQMLDGQSLMQCKKVCVRWRDLIERLEKNSSLWKRKMLNEAGMDMAFDMAANGGAINEETERSRWKRLYSKWHMTHSLRHRQLRAKMLHGKHVSSLASITCMCSVETKHGIRFITGDTDGFCLEWCDVPNAEFILSCMHPIHQICVVDFSDDVERRHVIVASQSGELKACSLNEPKGVESEMTNLSNTGLRTMKVYGHHLMVLRKDFIIFVMKLSLTSRCLVQVQHLFSYITGVPGVNTICPSQATLWNDKIICVGKDFARSEYDLKLNVWKHSCIPQFDKGDLYWRDRAISNVYLFRNGVTVILTIDNGVSFSIDGSNYVSYVTLKDNLGYWTAVHIYGGILAVGTETGRLFVYSFKRDEELLNLALGSPVFTRKISNKAVTCIDITCNSTMNEVVLRAIVHGDTTVFKFRWGCGVVAR